MCFLRYEVLLVFRQETSLSLSKKKPRAYLIRCIPSHVFKDNHTEKSKIPFFYKMTKRYRDEQPQSTISKRHNAHRRWRPEIICLNRGSCLYTTNEPSHPILFSLSVHDSHNIRAGNYTQYILETHRECVVLSINNFTIDAFSNDSRTLEAIEGLLSEAHGGRWVEFVEHIANVVQVETSAEGFIVLLDNPPYTRVFLHDLSNITRL